MRALLRFAIFVTFVMIASAQNDCGNISFSGREGVVTSPNFPLPYPHDLNCTYSIDVGRNNSVILKFIDFDLKEPSYDDDNCIDDWLSITCNETDDENQDFTKRYCGSDLPRTSLLFSNCPVVLLNFFADSSINGGGFRIEYTVTENSSPADFINDLDCGVTVFTTASGVIRLPANTKDYSANVNCTYTIVANDTSSFSLDISSLQIPQLLDSFEDCNRDNIRIGCLFEGERELNPNTTNAICRTSFDDVLVPPSHIILSNCSTLMISIRSSDYDFREDLNIPFRVSEYDKDCGIISFTGSTGNVTSPQFPLEHPHNLNCTYSIDVDRTKAVTLDFLTFDLEDAYGTGFCFYDWMTVSCLQESNSDSVNPDSNKKYCGDKRSKPMLLNFLMCDSLTVNFVTDSSNNRGGFQFQYTITTIENTTLSTPDDNRGNVSLAGPTGFITSPRFPLHYPYNSDYVYSIEVDRNKTVGFLFYSFNLEGTSRYTFTSGYMFMDNCQHDWLKISCLSGDGSMSLDFEHHNYPDFHGYVFHIGGYRSRNRKFCGVQTSRLIVSYTNCDILTLNFVSDSSVNSEGFKIWYAVTSPGLSEGCGNTLFSGSNGTIMSPNFPLSYPHNMSCTYSIDVRSTSSVLLKFKYFQLKEPNSAGQCINDYLMISCNETTKVNPNNRKRFCGFIRWTSSLRFVACSSLVLEFVSGPSTASNAGFMIEYTVETENPNATDDNTELDCGSTLFTDSSGVINLPMNPLNILASVNCTYTISTNQTSLIWFSDSRIQSPRSLQDCETERITVGCVSEEETEVNPNTTKVVCRRRRSILFYSDSISSGSLGFGDCRTLKLSMRSNTYDNRETFQIPFSVLGSNEVCGNTSFSAPTGIISSPEMPIRCSKCVNCQYTIDCDGFNSVSLTVGGSQSHRRFRYTSELCVGGWMSITCLVNGTLVDYPLAGRNICGLSALMSTITFRFSACHSVFVNFSGDLDTSVDRGFSLRYRVGNYELDCGSTLFTNSSGIINLPGNPTNFPASVNCTYTISATSMSHIWLRTNFHSQMMLLDAFQDCDSEGLTIGCISEGETELNPNTTKFYCGRDRTNRYSEYNAGEFRLIFIDCPTLRLSIRSNTYNPRWTVPISYSVFGPSELCGNTTFSASTGIVSTPRLPFHFPKSVNCLYVIESDHVNSIVLSVDRLNIESELVSNGSCSSGWLTISCLINETTIDHPLTDRKLCGGLSSTVTRFPACRSVLLNFSSDYLSYERGFTIRYRMGDFDPECGNTSYSGPNGFITSPQFPLSYPHNLNCLYSITGGQRNAMSLSFLSFNVKGTSNEPSVDFCTHSDWITVSCLSDEFVLVNTSSIRKYCGMKTNLTFSFPICAVVVLNFVSDSPGSLGGFKVNYTVTDLGLDCGTNLFTNSSGFIRFPRNPTNIPALVNCTYTISANRMSHIWITTDVHSLLRSFQDCDTEGLTISCISEGETGELNPNRTAFYCGRNRSSISGYSGIMFILIDCRTVRLSIRSNTYDLRWTMYNKYTVFGPNDVCGNTTFSASTGIVSTPRERFHFPKSVNCLYVIESDHVNSFVLSIDRLIVEPPILSEGSCSTGWLTIYCLINETSMDHPLADRKLCGGLSSTVARFPACRSVLLNFSSDSLSDETGFTIRYRMGDFDPECGNTTFSGPTGFITSPQFPLSYPHNLNCLYSIASGGQRSAITLSFLSFSLDGTSYEPSVDYCYGDYLTVSCLSDESNLANTSSSRKYCGVKTTNLTFSFPSCAVVVLKFVSNSYRSGEGFKVWFSVKDADLLCGATAYDPPNGAISFPWDYDYHPGSITCRHLINATVPSWMSFTIWSISIRRVERRDCRGDVVWISCIDVDTTLNVGTAFYHRTCEYLNSSVQMTLPGCTVAQVYFYRDAESTGKTFLVEYTVANNGGNLSATTAFPMTSVFTTRPVGPSKTCATGCKLSSDSNNCVCLTDTTQNSALSVSTEIPPVTRSVTKCEVGCKISPDGTTCHCPTTRSDISQTAAISISTENPPITRNVTKCGDGCKISSDGTSCQCLTSSSGGGVGRSVGISLTVILLVTGAICLGVFLLFKRYRRRYRPENLLEEMDEDGAEMELKTKTPKSGSSFRALRIQDGGTSKYLPLRPMSLCDREEPSSSNNSA